MKRAHTPKSEQLFVCDICSGVDTRRFVDQRGLTRHMDEVHSHMRSQCIVCNELFYRPYKLSAHMAEKHPEMNVPGAQDATAPQPTATATPPHTPRRRRVSAGPSSAAPSTVSSRSDVLLGPQRSNKRAIDPRLDSTPPSFARLPPTPTSMSRSDSKQSSRQDRFA